MTDGKVNDSTLQDAFVFTGYELRPAIGDYAQRHTILLPAVFRLEHDAYTAIEVGSGETVHSVRMVTVDGGRTGWLVGNAAWPICHDVDDYLRERGLAKLSPEERSALPIADRQARATANRSLHATTCLAAGILTVHGAYERADEPTLVALFCDDACAVRAARGLSKVAGSDGETGPILAVTLDGGLSCYLIGAQRRRRIWDLASHRAERGRAKLTSEERAALGVALKPSFPAILKVYEALDVHVEGGIGGCLVKDTTGVGVFLHEADAQQAVKGLCNRKGENGETRPVRVLTLDGRTGWQLPFGQHRAGDCEEAPAVTVWHAFDAYLRERARARLTAGERLAILPSVEPETGGAPAAPPLIGVVMLYEATQIAERSVTNVVGYFAHKADAERAAKGPDGGGEVKEVPAVTLDGRSAWVLGCDGSTGPLTLWRNVAAHLRHRGLAKLSDDERRAWGLLAENVEAALTDVGETR